MRNITSPFRSFIKRYFHVRPPLRRHLPFMLVVMPPSAQNLKNKLITHRGFEQESGDHPGELYLYLWPATLRFWSFYPALLVASLFFFFGLYVSHIDTCDENFSTYLILALASFFWIAFIVPSFCYYYKREPVLQGINCGVPEYTQSWLKLVPEMTIKKPFLDFQNMRCFFPDRINFLFAKDQDLMQESLWCPNHSTQKAFIIAAMVEMFSAENKESIYSISKQWHFYWIGAFIWGGYSFFFLAAICLMFFGSDLSKNILSLSILTWIALTIYFLNQQEHFYNRFLVYKSRESERLREDLPPHLHKKLHLYTNRELHFVKWQAVQASILGIFMILFNLI